MKTFVFALLLFFIVPIQERPAEAEFMEFTEREIEVAYRYQIEFGRRLANPLDPEPCLYGKPDLATLFRGREMPVPCRFVNETLRHLKEISLKRKGTFFFPLDIGHADLAVPKHVWRSRYSRLPGEKILFSLLREPGLMALYYPAAKSKSTGNAASLSESGAIVGFYDGQPVHLQRHGPSTRRTYEVAGTVYLLAHRLGEMLFTLNGRPVMLDMSFDYDQTTATSSRPEATAWERIREGRNPSQARVMDR